ncbi:hypothetical protein CPB84DRAFT_1852219 [Gymnopilus junonius]|uniref:Uncharacterized protein n=1 Tax=Gymnopilus junonius TaxID=109634 RepID=A0A9P5NDT5_GYMJU|nr:hypothetical protein CPB84DRAFT_1852219 [Gymnopilus junonius]
MELELVQTPEEWRVLSSSGGVELYVRVRIKKSDYEETLGRYGSKQQRYSSFFNEWDFCLEFAGTPVLGPYDPNYDNDDDVYWRPDPAVHNDLNNSNEPVPFQVPHPSHETEAREE